ncbi:MAG: hypothetical protein GY832_33020 [Chloroflexi bacterium]|nr:hypothetical protein [Chloroflexota bacterium]
MSTRETTFEGYSYRTSSRFGGRAKIAVDGETVTVTGPRINVLVYRLWIATQTILLWAIVPALLSATILRDARYLVVVLVLGIAHWAVGTFGAVCFWELANVLAFSEGTMGETITFPMIAIKRVKIGGAWARNGLWFVIPHIIPMVNVLSQGGCVSFEAPDGKTGRDAVYALNMQTAKDAKILSRLLGE